MDTKLTAEQIAQLIKASKSGRCTPVTKKATVDTSKLVVGQDVYVLNGAHNKGQVVKVTPSDVVVQTDFHSLRFDREGKWLDGEGEWPDGGEECGPWHLWVGREWGWFMSRNDERKNPHGQLVKYSILLRTPGRGF